MTTRTDENRFAYLLEPIRDLAQNWNIDLARELEDYLSELETISIAFDGSGGQSLNFAEAALLIQGSACIYSKKVEYLYSLLYTTLDALIKKKHKKNRAASSVGPDGIDVDAIFDNDDPILSDFGTALRQRNNVDLDAENEEPYGILRKTQLVLRPPLSLISVDSKMLLPSASATGAGFKMTNLAVHESGALLLEERDRSLVDPVSRMDIHTHAMPTIPFASSASSSFDESSGQAGPFGSPRAVFARASLSPAVAHRLSLTGRRLSVAQASAVVGTDRRSSKSFAFVDDDEVSPSSVSHSLFSELTEAADSNSPAGSEPMALADVDDNDDEVLPDYQDFGVDGGVNIPESQENVMEDLISDDYSLKSASSLSQMSINSQSAIASQVYNQVTMQQHDMIPEALPFDLEEENDPWERLDPYEEVGNTKPFRKGKTYVKPKPPTEEAATLSDLPNSQDAQKLAASLSFDPLEEMVRKNISKGSIHVPYNSEFASAYLRNLVVRKRVAKSAKSVLSMLGAKPKPTATLNTADSQVQFASPQKAKAPEYPGSSFVDSLAEVATIGEVLSSSGLSRSTVGMLSSASNILTSSTAAAAAVATASDGAHEGTGLLDEALAAYSAAADLGSDDIDESDAGQVLFDLGAISSAAETGMDGVGAVEARDLWEEAAGAIAEEHGQENFSAIQFDSGDSQITKTYEELCREHVEQYLAFSARYITESSLVKRVNEWQRELEPLLIEEAKRSPFDIQTYGANIIYRIQKVAVAKREGASVDNVIQKLEQDAIKSEVGSSDEVEKIEVQVSKKEEDEEELKAKLKIDESGVPEEDVEINLSELLQRGSKYEVCRSFLATLQLANNGNVDIFRRDEPEDPSAMTGRTTRSGRELNVAVAAEQLRESSKDQLLDPECIRIKLLTTRRSFIEDTILSPSDLPKQEDESNAEWRQLEAKQSSKQPAKKKNVKNTKVERKKNVKPSKVNEDFSEESEFSDGQDSEDESPVLASSSSEDNLELNIGQRRRREKLIVDEEQEEEEEPQVKTSRRTQSRVPRAKGRQRG